jgi:CPA2 family monovalent cation:H+ antiporter-2/glutathione-regulated potassium-efflux system protein KefB
MLETLVALLAASVVLIPLSRRAGFGSVVGYLVGGAVIGPQGLRLVTNVEEIRAISELGVVMLLFLIGLELRPQRLWVMRKAVFALGPAQFVASTAAIAALAYAAGAREPLLSAPALPYPRPPSFCRCSPSATCLGAVPAATRLRSCCFRMWPSFLWWRWSRS